MTSIDRKADEKDSLKLDPSVWCCPLCHREFQVTAEGWECLGCSAVRATGNKILHIQSSGIAPELGVRPEWLDPLCHRVKEKGWEEGLKRLYPELSEPSAIELISIRNPKRYAWHLLMEFGECERALCLDSTLGSASIELAKRFGKVYCLTSTTDAGLCVERRVGEGRGGRIIPFVSDSIPHLPFRGAIFDAVVVTSIEQFIPGKTGNWETEDWIAQLAEEARRVLKPAGNLCLVGTNRFGYDRVRARLGSKNQFKGRPAVSLPAIGRALNRSVFIGQRVFSLLPGPYQCREIVPVGQGGFNTSYLSLWDRIKRRIKSSRQFTPGFFLSASKSGSGKALLGLLLEECHLHLGKALGWKSAPRMVRLLVTNPNGAILMAGGETAEEQMVVVRIPLDEATFTRCQNNQQALIETRKLGGWMSTKVPEFLMQGEIHAQSYFVEKGIQGKITVEWDHQVPLRTTKSVEALLELHRRAARKTRIDETVFETNVVPALKRLKPLFNVQQMELLRPIEDYLRESFMGKELSLVRTHGDYKIENVIFNEKETELIGVIDWDLSRPQGLPFLDLIHLLAYNRILREHTSYGEVISQGLFRQEWEAMEIPLVQHYLEVMEIEDSLCVPLCLAYWLDHAAFRSNPEIVMIYPQWAEQDFARVARSGLENVVRKRQ